MLRGNGPYPSPQDAREDTASMGVANDMNLGVTVAIWPLHGPYGAPKDVTL
jgi:hypothetical protein